MKSFFLFIAFNVFCFATFAQTSAIVKVQKFKPPVVVSYLGENVNGTSISKEEASGLISLPVKVMDIKKDTFHIVSYQFLYKRKGVVEDEETSKKETTFTIVSDRFTATPLPVVWVDNIKDGFQSGEELYFFDIVVKDNKGRDFFAPDLKLHIQ